MYKILLSISLCLLFYTAEAATEVGRNFILVDHVETNLDFSKEFPRLKYLKICGSSGDDCYAMREFYLNQTSDLGLSKNRNLKNLMIIEYNPYMLDFLFLNCYLPQVNSFTYWGWDVGNWEFVKALPNLRELDIASSGYAPWELFAKYNLHLRSIVMSWPGPLSSSEITAIAKLTKLKSIICFSRFLAPNQDTEQFIVDVHSVLPSVNIKITYYNPNARDND